MDDSFICGRRDAYNDREFNNYIGNENQSELYTIAFKHYYDEFNRHLIFRMPYCIKPQLIPSDEGYSYNPDLDSIDDYSDCETEYSIHWKDTTNNTGISEMRSIEEVYNDYIKNL